jgi:hypothetical protein
MSLQASRLLAANQPAAEDDLTKIKREYGDILALQGTSKGEILAIARILRVKPDIAIDQTAASGEYCFNSGHGTMVHFATQPERTPEDIVDEWTASLPLKTNRCFPFVGSFPLVTAEIGENFRPFRSISK